MKRVVSIADLGSLTNIPFDSMTYHAVPQLIYMGSADTNDSLDYLGGWDERDAQLVDKLFGEDPVSRWDDLSRSIRRQEQMCSSSSSIVSHMTAGNCKNIPRNSSKRCCMANNPVASILNDYPTLVIDGALATELERRGCDLKDDLWSAKILLEQPEIIKQVHLDYFRVGADCAITASYQATLEGFEKRGLNRTEAIALMQKSVKLAAEAREEFWSDPANRTGRDKPFVAASVGPYGAFLADGSEYRGEYGLTEKELRDFHRPRMKALIEAGADMLACETIPCLIEAQAIANLLGEFPDITAWFSFSARDERHISEGQVFAECVKQLEDNPQIAAVGINCTSPVYIPSLIREAAKVTAKPILVYPNSGESYNAETNYWNGNPVVDSFGEQAREWYRAGARLIGGCCRTTPEDIRVIASWARPPR